MLNISVVSFYNNVGLIFKDSEDMVNKGIENCPLATTPPSTDASSRDISSEYPHKPYIARN